MDYPSSKQATQMASQENILDFSSESMATWKCKSKKCRYKPFIQEAKEILEKKMPAWEGSKTKKKETPPAPVPEKLRILSISKRPRHHEKLISRFLPEFPMVNENK